MEIKEFLPYFDDPRYMLFFSQNNFHSGADWVFNKYTKTCELCTVTGEYSDAGGVVIAAQWVPGNRYSQINWL